MQGERDMCLGGREDSGVKAYDCAKCVGQREYPRILFFDYLISSVLT